MSTDIIRFEALEGGLFTEHFSVEALRLFFAISIPLMVVTFVSWYLIYWWMKNRQKRLRAMQMFQDFTSKIERVSSKV